MSNSSKVYKLELSTEEAELVDIGLGIAASTAKHAPEKFKALQKKVLEEFEKQD